MDWHKFLKSFGYALQGIITLLRTEQNARVHFIVAITVGVLAYIVGVNHLEAAVLFFAISLVFAVEITNTAIEKLLDLVHPGSHRQVAFIKDAMAGATLISAIIAAVVGVLVFWPYVSRYRKAHDAFDLQSPSALSQAPVSSPALELPGSDQTVNFGNLDASVGSPYDTSNE